MNRLFPLLTLIVLTVAAIHPAHAQETADLPPFSQVDGEVAAGGEQNWQFTAVDGEVISLVVESTGDLDPVLTLISETGAQLLQNDDYNYPASSDAALQAVTIPFTGTYTARVTGFGNTAGDYQLTRLRGYADGTRLNGFTSNDNWETDSDALNLAYDDGQLTLELEGINSNAFVVDGGARRLTDYYQQVDVTIADQTGGWVVHTTIRQQNAQNYYLYSVSDGGFWRLLQVIGGTETVLRDWISHPAIRPGETEFEMGVLVNGEGITPFYNGSPLSTLTDDRLNGGVIGFGVGTGDALGSTATVQLSNLVITEPLQTADNGILPSQVILQDPTAMANSLVNRRVVPAGGDIVLNIPQSTIQSNASGISRLPLASGSTYANFALAADVSVDTFGEGIGACGVYLRAAEDERYILTYLDQTGGYGLAERDGDAFLPGIYGENPALTDGMHQLLVIANRDTLHLYVDGQYAGSITSDLREGSIGSAAVNFDPNTTNCTLNDTWMWAW